MDHLDPLCIPFCFHFVTVVQLHFDNLSITPAKMVIPFLPCWSLGRSVPECPGTCPVNGYMGHFLCLQVKLCSLWVTEAGNMPPTTGGKLIASWAASNLFPKPLIAPAFSDHFQYHCYSLASLDVVTEMEFSLQVIYWEFTPLDEKERKQDWVEECVELCQRSGKVSSRSTGSSGTNRVYQSCTKLDLYTQVLISHLMWTTLGRVCPRSLQLNKPEVTYSWNNRRGNLSGLSVFLHRLQISPLCLQYFRFLYFALCFLMFHSLF